VSRCVVCVCQGASRVCKEVRKIARRALTCCSLVQYAAVCCSVLQCVAVCCSVLQRVAVRRLRIASYLYVTFDSVHQIAHKHQEIHTHTRAHSEIDVLPRHFGHMHVTPHTCAHMYKQSETLEQGVRVGAYTHTHDEYVRTRTLTTTAD